MEGGLQRYYLKTPWNEVTAIYSFWRLCFSPYVFIETTLFELQSLIQRTLSVVHARRMLHAVFCNIL